MTRRVTIKNSIKAVLAAFALIGLAGTSEAVSFSYVDIDKPAEGISFGDGYHGLFNIVNPGTQAMSYQGLTKAPQGGYNIGTQLLSAKASFYLFNPSQNLWETASVYIGLLDGEWTQSIPTGHSVLDFNASPISLFLLQNTGAINYAVHSSLFGNFRLEYAVLEVETVSNPPSNGPVAGVPDGGATLLLMGLGFLGLVAAQTRLTRQAA